MRRKHTYRGAAAAVGAVALFLTGCPGDESGITCGPNTEEVDGKCVSTVTNAPCGEGTSRDPDTGQCEPDVQCGVGTTHNPLTGECEPDSRCGPDTALNEATGECEPNIVCGPDTTFDPNTGACRPDMVCGEGAHLDPSTGECVPDDNCGEGTSFDPSTGTCVPDLVCGPGLTNIDGVCLSALDIILEEADVFETIPDLNDPAMGGSPEAITLKPTGERLVLSGTIQRPVDLNGDGVADQDVDAWRFSGSAGQLLRIRVLSTGAFQPGFALSGPNGYYREPQVGYAADADRQVILPFDGEYDLAVLPSLALQGATAPIGGDDAVYAAIVEELEWPALGDMTVPTSGDSATATGNLFDLRDNFFVVSADANAPIVIEATTVASNTEPVLLFFANDRSLQRKIEFGSSGAVAFAVASALYDEAVGLVAVLDWRVSDGVDAPFELNARASQAVEVAAVAENDRLLWPRVLVPARSSITMSFAATEGQVLVTELHGLTTGTSDLVLLSPSGAMLYSGAYRTNPHPIFYAQETGTYRWIVLNGGNNDARVAPGIFSFTPEIVGPLDGTTEQTASFSGDQLGPNIRPDGAFFLVETTGPAVVRADFDRKSGMPDYELYPVLDDGTLGARRVNNEDSPQSLRRLHEGAERTLIRYTAGSTGRLADPIVLDWRLDITVTPQPTLLEVEPNDDMGTTQAVSVPVWLRGQIADDEFDFYTVTLDSPLQAGEALLIDVESMTGSATSTWMRIREVGSSLEEPYLFESAQVPLSRWMLFPAQNLTSFVLELEGTANESLDYILDIRRVDVGLTETEPNDVLASANDLGTFAIADLPIRLHGDIEGRPTSSSPTHSDFFQLTLSEELPAGHALLVRVDDILESADLNLDLSYAGSSSGQVLSARHEEAALLASPAAGVPLTIQVSDTQTAGMDHNIYQLTVDVVPSFDVEPNGSTSSASPLGNLEPDTLVRFLGIAGDADDDYYRLDLDEPLVEGEAIRVSWSITTIRGNLDVYIRDAAGSPLLRSDHYHGELLFAPIGAPGPFYVHAATGRSSTSATNAPELYQLEVERFRTSDVIEQEPNDTMATAQAIIVPATIQGTVNDVPATPDIFAVTLAEDLTGGEVLIVDGFTPFLEDLSVRVFDSEGEQLDATADILPYLEVSLPVTTAGTTYYVEVLGHTSLAVDEEQRYELSLDVAVP